MSAPQDEAAKRLADLQAELETVKRREAEFRAKMVLEFLDRGERNSLLHVLREERAALLKREQEAFADLEYLTRKLETETLRSESLESELRAAKDSLGWRLGALLGAGSSKRKAALANNGGSAVLGGEFTYYLHTSPFRIYRAPTFTLRGWAWPADGRAITAIRVDLDGRVFVGRTGIEEPEVIERHGPQANNPHPGFEVSFETPDGRHRLSLEAQLGGSEWRSILTTTVWSEREPR
jgi:hypothetical protein